MMGVRHFLRAGTVLKFAKREGADARARASREHKAIDDTRINFMVVTGGSSNDFKIVHHAVYYKKHRDDGPEFYATLRSYTPDDLQLLLSTIRRKEGRALGRSKLHQLREAVLKMNLTTSVGDGLAVRKNWRTQPRNYIVRQVYEFGARHQLPHSDPNDPVSGFPRVSFPWFADDPDEYTDHSIYRTPLLDFIELYDFVAPDGGDSSGGGGDDNAEE
jgi:hypothetical protein